MLENLIKFEKRSSLEKKKIRYYIYEYFIVDNSSESILELDSKYYNINEIGKLELIAIDDEDREYDDSFRFYEFSYDIKTPKYTKKSQSRSHMLGEYKDFISEEEGWETDADNKKIRDIEYKISKLIEVIEVETDPDLVKRYKKKIEQLEEQIEEIENQEYDDELITDEIGGDSLTLKAILNDNGDVIIEGIKSVHQFIESIGAIIIKLPIYKGSIWNKNYDKCWGENPELWAVVDLSGKLIIEPVRAKIEFFKNLESFVVGDMLMYNQFGIKSEKEFENFFHDSDDFTDFKFQRDKYLNFKDHFTR